MDVPFDVVKCIPKAALDMADLFSFTELNVWFSPHIKNNVIYMKEDGTFIYVSEVSNTITPGRVYEGDYKGKFISKFICRSDELLRFGLK